MAPPDSPGAAAAVVVVVVTLIVSGFVVGLRLYTRGFILQNALGWDDWLILVAWVTVFGFDVCILLAIGHGYGQRMAHLTPDQFATVLQYATAGQFFAMITYLPAKSSVAICLGRVFPSRTLRWILWAIAVANAVLFSMGALLYILRCLPPAKSWNPAVAGTCLDLQVLARIILAVWAVGAATDFALAAIPIYYVAKLQIRRREKVALGVALGLGFGAGGFALVKCDLILRISATTDYTYDSLPLLFWLVAEHFAILVGASIPMLRPLLRHLAPDKSRRRRQSTLRSMITADTTTTELRTRPSQQQASLGRGRSVKDPSHSVTEEHYAVGPTSGSGNGVSPPRSTLPARSGHVH